MNTHTPTQEHPHMNTHTPTHDQPPMNTHPPTHEHQHKSTHINGYEQSSHRHHAKHPCEERIWVEELKDALSKRYEMNKHATLPLSPSIFMAPAPLRGLNHQAFIPQVVPIGPYHCDIGPHHSSFPENRESERFKEIASKEMERHKIMASKYVEKGFRTGSTIFHLAETFKSRIEEVRQEYESRSACNQSKERLAFMLALDACFVVAVLKCNVAEAELQKKVTLARPATLAPAESKLKQRQTAPMKSIQRPSTQIGSDRGQKADEVENILSSFNEYYYNRFPLPLRKSILQDFVMLENQVPLFCLLEVIRMEDRSSEEPDKELAPLVLQIAVEVLPFFLKDYEKLDYIEEIKGRKHLLDCLYAFVTHATKPTTKKDLVFKPTHFPRAVDLHHSGISFKPLESGNLLGVRFERKTAILYVPKVRVGDDTERLFRNLIAYESHMIDNVHVLSYLRFMNNLVDDADDVALLVQKGIITEDIGSDKEVADMWNNLCVNTMRVCSLQYEKVALELESHCHFILNTWKADLKRTYFSKPWLLLSLCSGFILLAMTLIIMLYTILIYYRST